MFKNILKSYLSCMGFVILMFWMSEPSFTRENTVYDESLYNALHYRCIGPFRGGRSAAVAGVKGDEMTYYFGGTGGGVWETVDGGKTWSNISDGYFGGSIGAVAVSEWDANVIYAGGGEKTVRGNVSHGSGMWKSVDKGKTWISAGLKDSRHICRIQIHPKNPDIVYAAALGHLFRSNEQRGIYKTIDGGSTWKRVLFVNDEVGAVDIEMDPTNPRILYASLWRILRTPYSLESGGPGSGIWKSTDSGETWEEITRNKGLPRGMIGINKVAVSPANPDRVWAIIEADDGGVFRSEDAGKTWTRVNDERKLRQRAWYYTRIYADSKDENCVYVLNVQFWKSQDGGETFESIRTPHGDHHDLWIAPEDPERMIIGDDGGAQISFDGGNTWSTYHNQPTAQFYRVITDDHFPYRIYGAQQDNSTVRILHRSDGRAITEDDWEPTAGGESGWIAPDPENPDIVYGGSYGGYLQRLNHETGEFRLVNVWPDNPMGHGAGDLKYRFQWNYPIFFSSHDPDVLYAAGNCLFRTTNEGQSWERISPDLTRNDPSKLGPSGGPITKDNTSVEYYCTIFTAAESPHEPGVIWTGSDDGLIYLTRDGGKNWENITPPEKIMPEWIQINSIEPDPFDPGGLYVAATMYKWDDFSPYLYKTSDYGKSWKKIVNGIDKDHFTRVIRSDPHKQGILYAGTEQGMYISFNDGRSWQSFQLNLPVTPITDCTVKNTDLVVATQGRSFWVLDDLTPLYQLNEEVAESDYHLFQPRPTYRLRGGRSDNLTTAGENPPAGVVLHYYFKNKPDSDAVCLKILEEEGTLIKKFRPDTEEDTPLTINENMNRFVWDMRYPDAETFKGLILWAGMTQGPRAVPGTYKAQLRMGEDSSEVQFDILKDPRSESSQEDLKKQFDFLTEVRDKLSETHSAIKTIRKIRSQIKDVITKLDKKGEYAEIDTLARQINEKITSIEKALYQTKNKSRQDPLNYPIRLNNRLSSLARVAAVGDYPPTEQAIEVKELLFTQINNELQKLDQILDDQVPQFNQLIHTYAIPVVEITE